MMPLKVCFYGSAPFVLPLLKSIIDANTKIFSDLIQQQLDTLKNFTIQPATVFEERFNQPIFNQSLQFQYVVTQPNRSRRGKLLQNSIAQFCTDNNVLLWQPQSIKNVPSQELSKYHADIGVVAAYGQIIPQKIIQSYRYGLLNWHPSKLPQYRGPTPVQTALLNNENKSALSWIDVAQKMDSGDIYVQSDVTIFPTDTFISLNNKFVKMGINQWAIAAALKILDHEMLAVTYSPKRQKHTDATYSSLLTKEDRYLELNSTVEHIYNHYRAYKLFPKTSVFSTYFNSWMTLQEVVGAYDHSNFLLIKKKSSSVQKYKDFMLITNPISGKRRIFWLPSSGGALEVISVILPTGKNINFAGYSF